jgi:hypothetical protein
LSWFYFGLAVYCVVVSVCRPPLLTVTAREFEQFGSRIGCEFGGVERLFQFTRMLQAAAMPIVQNNFNVSLTPSVRGK